MEWVNKLQILADSADKNEAEINKLLKENKKYINDYVLEGDDNPLCFFIKKGCSKNIVLELLKIKANINQGNKTTPFLCALGYPKKNYDIIDILIEQKANINAEDENFNAIHLAARNHKVEVLKVLLRNDALSKKIDYHSNSGFTPLHYAIHNGDEQIIKILIDNKANANIRPKPGSINNTDSDDNIYLAIFWGKSTVKIIEYLLNNKSYINDEYALNPALELAIDKKKHDIIKLLKNKIKDNFLKTIKLNNKFFFIPYKDIKIVKYIGNNASAKIYNGSWRNNEIAIKLLKKNIDLAQMQKEIMPIIKANSNYIITLRGVCIGQQLAIVTEYLSLGSLCRFLAQNKNINWSKIFRIGSDIGFGLNHLHNENILHRNLNSECILLTNDLRAKICDFSNHKIIKQNQLDSKEDSKSNNRSFIKNKLGWLSPELLQGHKNSKYSDIYSYGVILWELFSKQIPHSDKSNDETEKYIKEWKYLKIPDPKTTCELELISKLDINCLFEKNKLYLNLSSSSKKLEYQLIKDGQLIVGKMSQKNFATQCKHNTVEELNCIKEDIISVLLKRGHTPNKYCPEKFKNIIERCWGEKYNSKTRITPDKAAVELLNMFEEHRTSIPVSRLDSKKSSILRLNPEI